MKKLWEIQQTAAKNKELSADAFRLLYLICSRWPRTCVIEPFKLSAATAAEWLGYSRESDHTAERAISGLLKLGYLVKRGCVGSPPTNLFLVFNSCQPTGIKTGRVTVNHISNSLREEMNPNGRNSSSLRSTETNGGKVEAASPRRKATDAELRQAADDFAALKKSLKVVD